MQVRILRGFVICFLASFAGLWFLSRDYADSEVLWLLLVVSFVLSLFFALALGLTKRNDEISAFGSELSEGIGSFSRSISLLSRSAFQPLWLAGAALVSGAIVTQAFSVLGCLLILFGQANWIWARPRLRRFAEGKAVPIHLEAPLLWKLRLSDAFFALATWITIEALGAQGILLGYGKLIALSLAMAAALTVAYNKVEGRKFHAWPLHAIASFIWSLLLVLTLNYGLDFRPPLYTEKVSKRECIDRRERILAGTEDGTGESGRYSACPMLEGMAFPVVSYDSGYKAPYYRLESTAETLVFEGALGIGWRTVHIFP